MIGDEASREGDTGGANPRTPPPGFYPHPDGRGLRWWNGNQWTELRPKKPPIFTRIEKVVIGLAIAAVAIWPAGALGGSGDCSGYPNTALGEAQCQRDGDVGIIQLACFGAGIAAAGLVLAIYARHRRKAGSDDRVVATFPGVPLRPGNQGMGVMIAMIAGFIVDYLIMLGLIGSVIENSYGSLGSLSGYGWQAPFLLSTAVGVIAGLVIVGFDRRSRRRQRTHLEPPTPLDV